MKLMKTITLLFAPLVLIGCDRVGSAATPEAAAAPAAEQVFRASARLPEAYRLDRPLLAGTPGALVHGRDWQGLETLEGEGFRIGSSGRDAASVPVAGGPPGARRAELVDDPVFGRTPRVWFVDATHGRAGQGNPWDTRYRRTFPGVERAWYRALYRFSPDFDARTAADYRGNSAHKIFYVGSTHRLVQVAHVRAWQVKSAPERSPWGRSREVPLPGSPAHGGTWLDAGEPGRTGAAVWGSGEWFEVIAMQERVSESRYRVRVWLRQVTRDGELLPEPVQVLRSETRDRRGRVWAAGIPARYGFEHVDTQRDPGAVADGITLFDNRNGWLPSGQAIWAQLGPYEVIDADRVPDPYGLADDMLQ